MLRYLFKTPIRLHSLKYFLGLPLICMEELLVYGTTKLFLAYRCEYVVIDLFHYAVTLYHGFSSGILLTVEEHSTYEIHICWVFVEG